MTTNDGIIRATHVIARLNIGGVAVHAITLAQQLGLHGYRVHLVRGREGADEGNMDDLARELGVSPTLIGSLRRDPGPGDLDALWRLVSIIRRDRPQIVHTHAAKAGALGRAAALIAFPRASDRPVLVHTYHGHSLTGYFSARKARAFLEVERQLARRTNALIAVSNEVRDDLVRLGVAAPDRFTVIPYGFDLTRFMDDSDRARRRAELRAGWGVDQDTKVITLIARLVPIKRVDRFLRVARLLADRPQVRFVVVGDGELRDELVDSADARALGDRLVWAGFRSDVPDVCFASDLIVLTSDNEGTPVSLIEAQAAALPIVSTDVGGVRSAIRDGETGILACAEDDQGLADAAQSLLDNDQDAARMGAAGRRLANSSYGIERMVDDYVALYRGLLEKQGRGLVKR